MRTVAHLTSVHQPFDSRIFHKECRTLAEAGYGVTLIAAGGDHATINGIRLRVVTRAQGRLGRMTRVVFSLYRAALREKAHVYHFHDPELILIGLLLKLARKCVIYDAHEDVALDILNKYWVPRGLRRLLAKAVYFVELAGARAFDGIVAATPLIAQRFPSSKTVIVQNFPRTEEFVECPLRPYAERPPLVAYVGRITQIRGINEVVTAMNVLPEALGARLALAGFFSPQELEDSVRSLPGWQSVEFVGWKSRQGIASLLSQARLGLVVLHPRPSYFRSYPIKLFEYMAAGIPVVASDLPLWREIIDSAGCGLLVNPLDPKEIAGAIQWLLEHPREAEEMGQRGLKAVHERYTWDVEGRKLLAFYKSVLGAHSA